MTSLTAIATDNDTLYYKTNNEGKLIPCDKEAFGCDIISNQYMEGEGRIVFNSHVCQIGDNAFKDCWRLTHVTLPKHVIKIGNSAFQNCLHLQSIDGTDQVQEIGNYAFFRCQKLQTDISAFFKVNSIGEYAFANCLNLTDTLSSLKEKTKISDYAFIDCPEIDTDSLSITSDASADSSFIFLTWNIQGLVWGTDHKPEEEDSIISSKGIKQLIAQYNPRIQILNEVPSYMCEEQYPFGTSIRRICGNDENRYLIAPCLTQITNAIISKDILIDRTCRPHTRQNGSRQRHYGIATQYINGKNVAIGVVHFEPTPNVPEEQQAQFNAIRLSQAKDIVEDIKDYEYAIVAGDFNCSRNANGEDMGGVSTLFEEAGFEEVQMKKSWLVDHIFVKGFDVLNSDRDKESIALSDHYLLWAELKIR